MKGGGTGRGRGVASVKPVVGPQRPVLRCGGRRAKRGGVTLTRAVDMFAEEETALNVFQTMLLFLGGAGGIAAGVAVPMFYQSASEASEKRPNSQVCFVCRGTAESMCRFCSGMGQTPMTLGSGETRMSICVNCSGAGKKVCTTCAGTGIQPRYLDRRVFAEEGDD
mmetsp:Transcript_7894/g.22602  ORF Transcript_7894/g.22602 Transcript_7894/m.22602 type:complete len:166 (-) Transcript_7894:2149-2646(-)